MRDGRPRVVEAEVVEAEVVEHDTLDQDVAVPGEWDVGPLVPVLDAIFDAIVVVEPVRDADGAICDLRCVYANAAVEPQLGYRPDELRGSTLLTTLPRLAGSDLMASFVAVAATGEAADLGVDWHDERASGTFEVRARGLGERFVLTIRDVSERRALETAAAESAAQIRQVIDALPMGVAVVDAAGTATFVNRAAVEMLGLDALSPGAVQVDEIPEKLGLVRMPGGEPYPSEELALARVLRTAKPATTDDIELRRGDGRRIPVETHATPLFGIDGSLQGAVSVTEDVTERRAREARLARALTELTAANEQLGEFAAMAAHDLAAPLRTIVGFADLLGERFEAELGPQGNQWLDFIRTDATRMRSLIEDLLAYARAGAAVSFGAVSLEAVASSVVDALGVQFAELGASLEVEPELPMVEGDASALYVLLRNLAANALKFRRDDVAAVVQIGAQRDEASGDWIVTVADNGIGVPEAERDRLFEPFSRGEASVDRPGNGMGLSICRRIVERHGGRIWFEPAPQGGSRFRVALPAPS